MRFAAHLLILTLLLGLPAGCGSARVPVVATSTELPSPTPSTMPTPVPTSTPVPIPTRTATPVRTPTPAPTIDRAVVASTVGKGFSRLSAAGIDPLCLRWEDADGDGGPEWVGLYLRPGEPPQLAAFVLDGEVWHDLLPLEQEKHGLGEYPTCEVEIGDVNADGRVEVLVWGHADVSIDLLHIFGWNGTEYELMAPFDGNAGVTLERTGVGLADAVIVGHKAGADLVWEVVYNWDGANYGWTWDRYTWFYMDRPHVYVTSTPERSVISYYLAVNDRDLVGAYRLLNAPAQGAQSYEEWAVDLATTLAVEASAVREVSRAEDDVATVAAQVRVYDNVESRVVATLWDVKWTVVRTPDGWQLDRATASQLDQWELEYYQ